MASCASWADVFNKSTPSVFYAWIGPKADKLNEINAIAKRAKPADDVAIIAGAPAAAETEAEAEDDIQGDLEVEDSSTMGANSTAFFVGSNDTEIFMLTSAHGLDHLYTEEHPLTLQTMRMFEVWILCDHYEQDYQHDVLTWKKKYSDDRGYGKATIVGGDSSKDILLLSVKKKNITSYRGKGPCKKVHPSLVISMTNPKEANDALMISWPSHHTRTTTKGPVGPMRVIDAVGENNEHGYKMKLLEVYMKSMRGSSGAPLLNAQGEVIGLLHGGFEGNHSYFVAVEHIRAFLRARKVGKPDANIGP
ncbi:uncharacterized protein LOC104584713 [Brachypodium distachyon]|uniref:Peptidase S1 domain-containing protein n=1 Tax=Brachypodium distachyon TaxID=15368 RepID=A0A0Q3LEV2_BRADI|nr:uncharacterized protein LOC104584713 [Brachypodium distachyon]KQJ91173.1 hypothetical protein BRADI_4g36085v3 [Brachypodium distachyon]|eukprot:XP_010238423.1 uncharacterized protein LOC104584713 [Brachypodium distachyon]